MWIVFLKLVSLLVTKDFNMNYNNMSVTVNEYENMLLAKQL